MDKMKCHICSNYFHGLGQCKYCEFEYDDSLPWTTDTEWDIFDVDSEVEWSFLQIQYRLKSRGVDCLQVLDWWDNSVIVLIGVRAFPSKVAEALKVH
jgi:rubredoxin